MLGKCRNVCTSIPKATNMYMYTVDIIHPGVDGIHLHIETTLT